MTDLLNRIHRITGHVCDENELRYIEKGISHKHPETVTLEGDASMTDIKSESFVHNLTDGPISITLPSALPTKHTLNLSDIPNYLEPPYLPSQNPFTCIEIYDNEIRYDGKTIWTGLAKRKTSKEVDDIVNAYKQYHK